MIAHRALLAALAALAVLSVGAAPAAAALPQIDYDLGGPAGDNGWFTGPVTVKWTVTGETATSGCDTRTLTAETTGVQLTCTATGDGGDTSATTTPIRIDHTAPAGVTAAAERPPDAITALGAWYRTPVAIAWTGTDAGSGLAACTTLTYAGPDDPHAVPAGSCRDRAGNTSAPVPFALAYDATPPALTDLHATIAGTTATLTWTASPDTAGVTVVRTPRATGTAPAAPTAARTVLATPGPGGHLTDPALDPTRPYVWSVTARDAAGNATTASVAATAGLPVLRWRRVTGARYYNLQLFRGRHKLLSAWPTRARYALTAHWRYAGRMRRMSAGRYRWYVWPGYGPRAERRYGRLAAHGRLRIPASR